MRTLIDIQDDLLNDLLKESGTTVKKDPIENIELVERGKASCGIP